MLRIVCIVMLAASAAHGADALEPSQPDNAGPVKLLTASVLGGQGDDEIVAVAVAPDGTIVLAGNTLDLPLDEKPVVLGPDGPVEDAAPPAGKAKGWRHPSTCGFVARLAPDGLSVRGWMRLGHGAATIIAMKLDAKGNIHVLCDAPVEIELAGTKGKGAFIACLGDDATKAQWVIFRDGASDFGIDGNGDVVVLAGTKLARYSAGKEKWTATWPAHGTNRPGGMGVDPRTGVTAVVGYGMTNTGKEPHKDPYAHGIDREGKLIWTLWNPDPKDQKGAQFGGTGLMADTTGHAAAFGPGGKLMLMLFSDGGNSVCTRDPADPRQPLDKAVMDGVFQKTAGFGFKGASKTSVLFRVDAASGKLEKGTWMCAWLTPSQANGLGLDAAAADEAGRIFAVGSSASGCPTKQPWYTAVEGGYKGGGFLACFDKDFRMLQCGYFPTCGIRTVARGGDVVVIAGQAKAPPAPAASAPAGKTVKVAGATTTIGAVADKVRVFHPLQKHFGGGGQDGYFAVLKVGK
jgi:hypothetical protein